jgi:hypothetical protein
MMVYDDFGVRDLGVICLTDRGAQAELVVFNPMF